MGFGKLKLYPLLRGKKHLQIGWTFQPPYQSFVDLSIFLVLYFDSFDNFFVN